ncbi:MAG: TonB-dependent receptor [Bacteroidota bacterium]
MKSLFLAFIFSLTSFTFFSQSKFTISGSIKDDAKGEELIGAIVKVKGQNLGTRTNEYGFYSLTLPQGKYTLVITAMGFVSQEKDIDLNQNIRLDFQVLSPENDKTQDLEEVKVSGIKQDLNVKDPLMGVERLDPKELAKIPVLMGEKDIIKTMQLLPGVKSAGEGNSGYFVRGGGADQNLILLDEAPVYNASHLLGFFSTFNSDAIKDAVLYKGNQPANFGGRLASVLDIKMNEGNNKRYNVSGGLGLISSRLNVEGPIIKDKASFLVTARRTYVDLFLKASEKYKENTLYFYDMNAKLNYRLSKKDRLYLSGYFGRDVLGVGKTFGIDWGNKTGTVRWNRIVNDKLFSNTSFIFSAYDYNISIKSGNVDFDILSKIQDFNLKQEFQYFANTRNKIKFGANAIHHTITPGQIKANSDAGINVATVEPTKSIESAFFINNDWSLTENFTVNYGVRLSGFSLLGNGSNVYTYDVDGKVLDTMVYSKNEIYKTYWNIEPRVSFSYMYSKTASIKAAYARNAQNIHLVSNSTSSSPTDVWLSTSLNTKPELSDQVSLGWFKNFQENKYEFNVETYYKSMYNQIDYRNGANTQANDLLEGELLYGIGRAYGMEFILKKKQGKFTGWLSYTLSKTERKIDGINNNDWYFAKQDRTHDISLVTIYDINKKLSVSALFVFYTGNAVTFPSGKYEINGQTQFSFTERNASRMPDYHRLDLGLTWYRKNTEKFESSWNFSIYNTYARENAYSISFRENENDPSKTEAVQIALFKIIPAITYNFKFK